MGHDTLVHSTFLKVATIILQITQTTHTEVTPDAQEEEKNSNLFAS